MRLSRAAKWGFGVAGGLFAAAQLVRPPLTNPPVTAEVEAPAAIRSILRNSCYDCHSNETRLPWFDRIVPAYWLVARDVRKGRAALNFSEIGGEPPGAVRGSLYESVNQIRLGEMPPQGYTMIHRGAKVTPEQLAAFERALHPDDDGRAPPADGPEKVEAAAKQYVAWTARSGAQAPAPAPAPNGMAFFPDYKDWRPISTTDRFDNGTFRVILGNEIAIRAIGEKRIDPWPDGAALAKIAWSQLSDGSGELRSGEFVQVEFMLKDARKYAATQGWGFGRWRGADLTPYGKDASFTRECTGCHAPMHDNDFVYTMPFGAGPHSDAWNDDAALTSGLPISPFAWRVVTSSLDTRDDTMSTLYGDAAAVAHARSGSSERYPAGATLARVTWTRKADRHWFGGRIPGNARRVEIVTAEGAGAPRPYSYRAFEGTPLRPAAALDEASTSARIEAIVGAKPAVMP